MASLKDLRVRIASVRSTQKITSAMKMVAAAKLRRAQEQAEASRPYAERMARMLSSLAGKAVATAGGPRLLTGTGKEDTYLVIVASADRGLCGAFNSSIVREARRTISKLVADGKEVKILCVGKKSRDLLRRDHGSRIIDSYENISKPRPNFATAQKIADDVLGRFDNAEFDVCLLFYAQFKSAIAQIVTQQQMIPFQLEDQTAGAGDKDTKDNTQKTGSGISDGAQAPYEFEPEEEAVLRELLPRNISVQLFRALLENNASEQGSRMTAMDNATRNAGDMINKLTLTYNRTRQAAITSELIEIISAKEALK